jgi:hypothetical protein
MKTRLSKPVLLASVLAFGLADMPPRLRAQDPSAGAPQPSGGSPTTPAVAGGDASTAVGKPAAKKKKRKRTKKKKASAADGAEKNPGNGAAQGSTGDLSSGTAPAK